MIDPGGYRDILPPHIYVLFNELAATGCMLVAFFIAEFLKGAASKANFEDGFPKTLTYTVVFVSTMTWFGRYLFLRLRTSTKLIIVMV